MFDLSQIDNINKGDIIVLRDYHTLDQNNGEEFSTEITNIQRWENESLNMYGLEFVVDDAIFMILVRFIKGEGGNYDANDIRMLRQWDSNVLSDFDGVELFNKNGRATFDNFEIVHTGEEADGALIYSMKKPYPFWDLEKNVAGSLSEKQVAICEYIAAEANGDPVKDNYWAKNAFVEWYAYIGDEGKDGLVSLWFGWDLGIDDIDVFKR